MKNIETHEEQHQLSLATAVDHGPSNLRPAGAPFEDNTGLPSDFFRSSPPPPSFDISQIPWWPSFYPDGGVSASIFDSSQSPNGEQNNIALDWVTSAASPPSDGSSLTGTVPDLTPMGIISSFNGASIQDVRPVNQTSGAVAPHDTQFYQTPATIVAHQTSRGPGENALRAMRPSAVHTSLIMGGAVRKEALPSDTPHKNPKSSHRYTPIASLAPSPQTTGSFHCSNEEWHKEFSPCNKQFTKHSDMDRHRRTSCRKVPPYDRVKYRISCDCHASFRDEADIKRHRKTCKTVARLEAEKEKRE